MNSNQNIDKITALLIAVTLIGILLLAAVSNMIVTTSAKIDDVQINIKEAYARRQRYEKLIAAYQDIEAEGLSDKLKLNLPDGFEFISVIVELEELARLSENKIVMQLGDALITSEGFELDLNSLRNVSSVGTVNPEGTAYDFLEIEVSLRGDYPSLGQFLNLFHQSTNYMNITSMSIRRGQGSSAQIDTGMTIQVFVEKINYI